MRNFGAIIFLLSLLSGCMPARHHYISNHFTFPNKIAVLPLDNSDYALEGTEIVRFWINQRFKELKGFNTVPLEDVDETLNKMTFNTNRPLKSLSATSIGHALNVDAVVLGTLEEFSLKTQGLIDVRKVKANFKLVMVDTGEVMWASEGVGINSHLKLEAPRIYESDLSDYEKMYLTKLANHPLRAEIWSMIWDAMQSLPETTSGKS